MTKRKKTFVAVAEATLLAASGLGAQLFAQGRADCGRDNSGCADGCFTCTAGSVRYDAGCGSGCDSGGRS